MGTFAANHPVCPVPALVSSKLAISRGTTSQASALTVRPDVAASLSLTGLSTSIAVGTVDNGMVVKVFDRFGNIATGFADVVSFTSSDPLANVPGLYEFTAADAGIHLA
jgi:hypothetical protein